MAGSLCSRPEHLPVLPPGSQDPSIAGGTGDSAESLDAAEPASHGPGVTTTGTRRMSRRRYTSGHASAGADEEDGLRSVTQRPDQIAPSSAVASTRAHRRRGRRDPQGGGEWPSWAEARLGGRDDGQAPDVMFAFMQPAYRQDQKTDLWHSFRDCPDWPQANYVETPSSPETEKSTVTYCKLCFARLVQTNEPQPDK